MTEVSSRQPTPVVGVSQTRDVTLSLDTSTYASGDVLADMQEIANAVRANGGSVVIQSLTVIDKDDRAWRWTSL